MESKSPRDPKFAVAPAAVPPVAVPRRVAPKVTVTAELKSVAQSNSRVATSIAPVTVCISPPKPSEVSLPDRCPVPVEKKRTSPKPSKVLPVRCPVPVEKKRDVAAKVPARKPQIVRGAAYRITEVHEETCRRCCPCSAPLREAARRRM